MTVKGNKKSGRKAAIKRLRLLSFMQKNGIEAFRAKIEKEYDELILPNKVECQTQSLGGIECDMLVPELYAKQKIILYVHGGSFLGGSRSSYRGFCARVAHKTLCRVVIPDFRLAPSIFPASLKDMQSVFCALYAEEQIAAALDAGYKSGIKKMPKIIIMADGSGASIAFSLISTLKSKYKSSVYKVVFLSPWLDISDNSMVLSLKGARDEVLTAEGMRLACEMYADAENRNSALCSMLLSSNSTLASFPPVFIQIGEKEILLEDAKRAKDLFEKAGVNCVLDVWPGMMHLFQLSDDLVWECHLAIDRIGQFVREIGVGGKEEYFNQPPLEEGI